MDITPINDLGERQLTTAAAAESGRSAVTVYGRTGARLRQTVVALSAGRRMGEHKSPGDASILCLKGHVRVRTGGAETELGAGDLIAVPPQRYNVEAVEPSVLLLSVALH